MYNKADQSLWNGRLDNEHDKEFFRHFQVVSMADAEAVSQQDVSILGYAVDKGVELNKGRVGAAEGPDAIRKAFAGLPLLEDIMLADYGDVRHHADTLIETQKEYAEIAAKVIKESRMTFLIGGGHDIAYAHYLALKINHPNKRMGLINIDAHFDNRTEDYSTSGTTFKQVAAEADYLTIGVQPGGNTRGLFKEAERAGASYILADEVMTELPVKTIQQFIDDHDVILLTLCMDVIDSAFAPGVSAPAVLGLTPHVVMQLLQLITESNKVNALSIAEMNPQYDIDQRTAKLVAHLMHRVIYSNFQ